MGISATSKPNLENRTGIDHDPPDHRGGTPKSADDDRRRGTAPIRTVSRCVRGVLMGAWVATLGCSDQPLEPGLDEAPEFREGEDGGGGGGEFEAGTPTGSFEQGSVVEAGNFNYTIPITVPPGRQGMEPHLALSYTSRSDPGALGYVGWSLSGLSQIARCRKVLIRDAINDNIAVKPSDNFCLDGEKLVPLPEEESALPSDLTLPANLYVGAGYAPEDSSNNTRAIALMESLSGVEYLRTWLVLRPNKHYDWYGETENSRNWAKRHNSGATATISWLLSGREHLENRVDYSYLEDPTNCQATNPAACAPGSGTGPNQAGRYIDEIAYTQWTGDPAGQFGGPASLRRVKFDWTPSPPSSYRDGWVNGIRMLFTQRLTNVSVYGPNSGLVRAYELTPDYSFRTARELLRSVTLCDANGVCLPETQFEYTTDVDLTVDPYVHDVRFDHVEEFSLPTAVHCEPRTLNVADVDEDGFDDIFYIDDPDDPYQQNESVILRSSGILDGSTFANQTTAGSFVNFGSDKFFDADNDLQRELLNVSIDANLVTFKTFQFDGDSFVSDAPDLQMAEPQTWPTNVTLDLDGDGKQELVVFKAVGNGYSQWHMNIYSHDGVEWHEGFLGWIPWDPAFNAATGGGLAHDINGDGRTELIFHGPTGPYLTVTDNGALAASALGFPMGSNYFIDVNGDGLPDAVTFDYVADELVIRMNTGDGFSAAAVTPAPPVGFSSNMGVRVADFNEDGRQDVLLLLDQVEQQAELMLSNGETFYHSYSFEESQPLLAFTNWGPLDPKAYTHMEQWKAEATWKAVKLIDSNGDGLMEIAVASMGADEDCDDHVIRHLSQTQSRDGVFADRLIKVTDPLGLVEEVSYATLANAGTPCEDTVEDENGVPLPTLVKCVRRGIVVDEHRTSNGPHAPRVSQYHYQGARRDLRGRGWLGFEQIEEYETVSRTRATTRYDHSAFSLGVECQTGFGCTPLFAYPLALLPVEVEIAIEDGGAEDPVDLSVDTMTYERTIDTVGVGPTRYRVRLESVQHTEDETGMPYGQSRIQTTRFSDFDSHNFPRRVVHDSMGGRSVTVDRTFHPHDPTEALFGLVDTETRTYSRSGVSDIVMTSSRSYNALGQLEETIIEPGSSDPAVYARSQLTYRPDHLLERVEEFNLDASESRALELGWSSDGAFVTSRTNGMGESNHYDYFPEFGVLHTSTDANGAVVTLTVDSFGRPLSVSDPNGASASYTYSYVDSETPFAVDTAFSDGRWGRHEYDPQLRLIKQGWSGPTGVPTWQEIHHDELGRIHEVTIPWTVAPPDPAVRAIVGYDPLGRPISWVNPDGTSRHLKITGFNLQTWTDEVGRRTLKHYGADGLLTAVEDRSSQNTPIRTTSYDYDAMGRTLGISDGSQDGWLAIAYDDRGRVEAVESPDSGTSANGWNAFGEIAYSHRAGPGEGAVVASTTYDYDLAGRLRFVTHDDQTNTPRLNEYIYGVAPGEIGRLVSQRRDNDGDGAFDVTTDLGYDPLGRLLTRETTVGDQHYEFGFGYDTEGRLETMSYPEADGVGPAVRYHYNAWGTLDKITDESPTANHGDLLWQALGFELGRLELSQKGSAMQVARSYEPLSGRLDTISTVSNGQIKYSKDYAYYDDGQIESIVDSVAGVSETMTYDALARVDTWERAHASNSYLRDFIYDDARSGVLSQVTDTNGNSTLRDVVYGFGGPVPHAPSSTTDSDLLNATQTQATFEHDVLGREYREARDGQDFREILEFNGFDLPAVLDAQGQTIEFLYDSNGTRVSRDNSALGNRVDQIDGLYEHHMLSQPELEQHVYYIDSPEGRIGQWSYSSDTPNFELSFYETDARGSVDMVSSHDGQEQQRRFYSPFGADLDAAGNDVLPVDGAGYATHVGMSDLELIDMKARLYDPHKRRFLATDPIFLGFDAFAYTHNDPVNRIDPDGRCDELSFLCPPPPIGGGDDHGSGYGYGGPGQDAGGGSPYGVDKSGAPPPRRTGKSGPPRSVVPAPATAPGLGGHGSSGFSIADSYRELSEPNRAFIEMVAFGPTRDPVTSVSIGLGVGAPGAFAQVARVGIVVLAPVMVSSHDDPNVLVLAGMGLNALKIVPVKPTVVAAAPKVGPVVTTAAKGGLPAPRSLSNVATRNWYRGQLAQIPGRLDKSLPLRERALQAFQLRNDLKAQARGLMADLVELKKLPPPKTLADVVKRAYDSGARGDDIWRYVLRGAGKSNANVDAALGL